MKILVIEDDPALAQYLSERLSGEGCAIAAASSIAQADTLASAAHDVYIVDRSLPDGDGQSWLSARRSAGDRTPAIFLTALGSIADKVGGLGIADDYLVKPFDFEELWARLQALSRRALGATSDTVVVGALTINRMERQVTSHGERVVLMPMEYKLLDFLVANAGQVVTRTMLLESVWGFHFEPSTNIVQTYISRLRAKVDEPGAPSLIETVRGEGYRVALAAQ